MVQRVLESADEVPGLARLLQHREFPVTVNVRKGRPRSDKSNRLQQLWHKEAAEQIGDETAEEKRGYFKLTIGVPILRAEDEEFREAYDSHVKSLPYETKLAVMQEPIDFPCTRRMTSRMHKQALDELWDHYRSVGVELTSPEDLR